MSYWIRPNGINALKGVPGDPDNPPNTSDETIIFALQTSRQARIEFDQIFDSLLPEEQDRLRTLIEDNPARAQLFRTLQSFLDADQSRQVREGSHHVSGRRGGKGAQTRPVRRTK